jgi:hypothetical protein
MIKFVDNTDQRGQQEQEVVGDNIPELVTELVKRIRPRSKAFYQKELERDLRNSGRSIVDVHAGNGVSYTVRLLAQNSRPRPQPVQGTLGLET